jgi:hypothetical protein
MQVRHTDIEQSSRPKLPPPGHKEGPKFPKMQGPKIPPLNVGPSHDLKTEIKMGTYVIKYIIRQGSLLSRSFKQFFRIGRKV